jgi:hypothetical protein
MGGVTLMINRIMAEVEYILTEELEGLLTALSLIILPVGLLLLVGATQ